MARSRPIRPVLPLSGSRCMLRKEHSNNNSSINHMPFDINQTLHEMLQAIKTNLGDGWKKVKDTTNDFLQSRRDRLELLADLRINNELENEFFLKRLEDEKKILESELHALAV